MRTHAVSLCIQSDTLSFSFGPHHVFPINDSAYVNRTVALSRLPSLIWKAVQGWWLLSSMSSGPSASPPCTPRAVSLIRGGRRVPGDFTPQLGREVMAPRRWSVRSRVTLLRKPAWHDVSPWPSDPRNRLAVERRTIVQVAVPAQNRNWVDRLTYQ